MKRIVLLWCCMLLLLAGTLALSILWGAQAWEYAEYEHEYAEIRKAVIPVNPARMNSQREAPCEQTAHEQPVSEDDNNDNTQPVSYTHLFAARIFSSEASCVLKALISTAPLYSSSETALYSAKVARFLLKAF